MLSTTRLLTVFLAACSTQALALPIPRPRAQTPDAQTLDSCPTNGAIICSSDGTKFSMCNFGKAMPMGAVAAGTTCQNGKIVGLNGSQVPAASTPAQPSTSAMATTVAPQPVASSPKPVATNEPEQDEITSTITTTKQVKVTSTNTVMVTVTGEPPADSTVPSLTMATSVAAQQTPSTPSKPSTPPTGSLDISEDVILKFAPSASSCSGAQFPSECAPASVAATQISAALAKYNIETIGEAAAVISIMAFESANFVFNQNHFPGRPGQGTKAMLMPNFVFEYAQSLNLDTNSIAPGATADSISSQSSDVLVKILALVQPDQFTFGSAPWFYSAKCSDAVKAGLKGSQVKLTAWENYITSCVGTTVTPDRQTGFTDVLAALGGSISTSS